MRSCGSHIVSKHKEINNGDQYIAMDIYLGTGCIYKKKITSSGPRDYVGRSGNIMNTSLTLRTINNPKSRQTPKVVTNDVCIQIFADILE